MHTAETQQLIGTAMKRGLPTRDAEIELVSMLADLDGR
jgi:hypothetical protein